MSQRAKEFLDEFLDGPRSTGRTADSPREAGNIADLAVSEAIENGISEDELRSAADGDLAAYIQHALSSNGAG